MTVPPGSRTASVQSPVFPISLGKSYTYTPRVFVPGRSSSTAVATLTVLGGDPAGWEVLSWDGPLGVLNGVTSTSTLRINRPAPAAGLLLQQIIAGAGGPQFTAGQVAYFPPGATQISEEATGRGFEVSPGTLEITTYAGTRPSGPGDTFILYGSRASWLAAVVPVGSFALGSRPTLRSYAVVTQAVGIGQVAGPFGTTVSLISDTPGVTVPASVDIPAGSAGGVYTAIVDPLVQASQARVRASWNGQTTTNTIRVEGTPPDPNATPTPTPTPTPVVTPIPGDTVEPETHLSGPARGNVARGPITFKLTTSQAGSTFECRLDGPSATIGSYRTCPNRAVYTGLADGAYKLFVRSIDPSGNIDSTPDSTTFTVGPTGATSSAPMYPPPAPKLIEPEVGAEKIRSSTVPMWGYGSPGDQLHVYDDGTLKASTTLNDYGQWFLDVPNVADGIHRFTVRAGNAAGLSAPSPERLVEVFTKAPGAPVITSPCFNCNVPKTFTITGTAEPNTTLELFDVTAGSKAATFSSGNGNWSITITARAYGARRYYVTSTDAEGNESAPSKTLNVRV